MSMVGCFGDCGQGDPKPASPKPGVQKLGMSVVFHPPIQTVFREKEPTKWYTDMINSLAALGSDPNQLNQFGEAPLCMASYRAQGLIVQELLQRENINANIKGKHGRTPLYLAAEEGHIYIVKLLLLHPEIDVNCRNAPRGATPLMAASRRGHSRIVELLLQHPNIIPDESDFDGNNAYQHARTASVKCKLHSHSTRSRSLENVIPTRLTSRNLCHVSNSSSSSSSSLNSVGESAKRIHARNHSYPTDTSAEELPILPQSLAPLSQPLEEDITEDVVFEQKVHEDQQLLEGAEIALPEPHEDVAPNVKKDSKPRQGTESLHPLEYSSITSSHQSPKDKKRSSNEKSGSVSPRAKFFRHFESNLSRTSLSGSKASLQSSPDSPSRSPLSALARARNIFHFGEGGMPEK
ncbi:GA-binding protein subunit beta-1 isoform X2 [Eurytemora carolleeae]|uniref:GA-binding protein subunit beta-1 isoform X2 n=1 Tax=Eurytemora carolleeae TaxID=1294199 RepID=UPI000C76C4D1|nr:GA-binding protein subunit beta-1 isoform X2 [Eurytemora carolleeae]|eukprot:XP_023324278.1 GA-binding protein subunit beta-1-like isoform X2 [Eurytemora affinis]